MHARLIAVMLSASACFLAASGVILWSMLSVGQTLSATATHTSEELVPVLQLEGEVRKAELTGWTAAFGIYQGAPPFIRSDYDALAEQVDNAFADLHEGEHDRFAEEADVIHAAEQHWAAAKDGYEVAFIGDFANELMLAGYLGGISESIDQVIAALDDAQATELAQQQRAVSDSETTRAVALWLATAALLIGLAMMYTMTKMLCGGVVGAITQLREAAQRLSSGDWGHRVEVDGPAELIELGKSFNTMSDRLRQSHTELEHRALHDQLTGLGNRNLIGDRLEHASTTRQSQRQTDAFLVIDLDRFKDLNDTRGHALGDEALAVVARRIMRCVRDSDSVARLGGDEFGVLLEGINGLGEAEAIAKRIVDTISSPARLIDVDVIINASVGIASATHATTPTELISSADLAMYEAKRAGGATWRVFDETLRTALDDRVQLESDLRTAVMKDQIEVAYQAVYDIETMMIQRGSEARQKLQRLREHGVSISIDDFDTGKLALTRTIIELGRNLGLPCIAEGVETAEELAVLQDLNCDLAQGFLLHRPSPAHEVEVLFSAATVG